MRVLDRRIEMMAREELEQLQLERLQALLVRLRRAVRRYREAIGDTRVESLADLRKLPVTTPEDVASSFPYGLFALPLREIIRLDSTVGAQGKPLVAGHTRNDLLQWGRLVARQYVACGLTANDIVQVCLGGIHWGASGYVRGAEAIEASILAEAPNHVDHQLTMIGSYRPTVLVTTPYNAQLLVREMNERRMDPQSLSLRTVLLSRPAEESLRDELKAGLFADVRCNFGISEITDPGFCVQCEAGRFHANEDQFIVEVQDGEMIVTTLCREAMPLLRYRTGVACELGAVGCACGRTGRTFVPGRRLDGRMLVAETPLYENQIREALTRIGLGDHPFDICIAEHHVEIQIEVTHDLFTDRVLTLNRLCTRIESELHARFGIDARVRPVARRTSPQ